MKVFFDEVADAWTVEFVYYNRGCIAYFEDEHEAVMWKDYVESKERTR